MERIIFSISSEQKRWLAVQAQCQQISMAELIRQALKIYSHQQYSAEQLQHSTEPLPHSTLQLAPTGKDNH